MLNTKIQHINIPFHFIIIIFIITASTWTSTYMVPVELHALEVRLNSACSISQSDHHPNCSRFLNTLLIVDSTSLSWSSSPICASISSLTSSGLSSVPTWCLLFLVKLDINFIQRWRPIFRWSELFKASPKRLIYWCTESVSEKSCPLP